MYGQYAGVMELADVSGYVHGGEQIDRMVIIYELYI